MTFHFASENVVYTYLRSSDKSLSSLYLFFGMKHVETFH